MSSLKMLVMLIVFTTTAACSLLDPFVDRRRNAGVQDKRYLYVGRSKPDAPAICYNPLWTDNEELQKMADAECQKQGTGSHAKKTGDSFFTCKLFLPSHANYQCVKDIEEIK